MSSENNNQNVANPERIGSVVVGSALALYGAKRKDIVGAGLALVGAGLIQRGATGHCQVYSALHTGTAGTASNPDATIPHGQGIKVEKSVIINKSPEELYRFWRDFENLPRFMNHVEAVYTQDDTHSHWTVKAPAGKTVEWDAEVINDEPNQLIAWQSLEHADIANAGSVRFKELPEGHDTEVRVVLEYRPPAGKAGALIAKLWGEEPSQQVAEDLRRFKQLMEAGEIPTTHGQAHGQRSTKGKLLDQLQGA